MGKGWRELDTLSKVYLVCFAGSYTFLLGAALVQLAK